jgi:hypothetical protein
MGRGDKPNGSSGSSPADYDDYIRERAMLAGMEQDHYSSYEKAITTLSAGFLAFSLSFLGLFDKTGGDKLTKLPYLYWAWTLFGLSVLFVLLNYLVGAVEIRQQIHREERLVDGEDVPIRTGLTTLGYTLYIFTALAFIGGLVSLILFCGENTTAMWS